MKRLKKVRLNGLIAVDLSLTSTGIYFCNGANDVRVTYNITTGPQVSPHIRLRDIYISFRAFLAEHPCSVMVVENYAFAAHGNVMTKLAEVGGILKLACALEAIPLVIISSQTWKSIVGFKPKDYAQMKKTIDGRKQIAFQVSARWRVARIARTVYRNADKLDAVMIAVAVLLATSGEVQSDPAKSLASKIVETIAKEAVR